jgi:hypothetical protein
MLFGGRRRSLRGRFRGLGGGDNCILDVSVGLRRGGRGVHECDPEDGFGVEREGKDAREVVLWSDSDRVGTRLELNLNRA